MGNDMLKSQANQIESMKAFTRCLNESLVALAQVNANEDRIDQFLAQHLGSQKQQIAH